MNTHNYCHYIINLYTKNKVHHNKEYVDDEIEYIYKNIYKLNKNIIYLFKFNTNMYYVVNGITSYIQFANDINVFRYIWVLYNERNNREQLINNITKNIKKFIKKMDMCNDSIYGNIQYNKDKLKEFLFNIDTDKNNKKIKKAIRDYVIDDIIEDEKKKGRDIYKAARVHLMFNRTSPEYIQYGGSALDVLKKIIYTIFFPISAFNIYAHKHFPKGLSTSISVILGIIDVIFLLLTLIPFKDELMGAGLVISAIAFIYAWLRADFVGAVAYALSAIPLLGGVIGGFIKSSGETIKIFEFLFEPAESIVKLSDTAIENLKLEESIGKPGVEFLRSGIKSGTELAESQIKELIKQKLQQLAPKERKKVIDAMTHDPELAKELIRQMEMEDVMRTSSTKV